MDIASLLLALALFLIVAAFVTRPLLQAAAPENGLDTVANSLQARRAMVLSALADLDFEYSTGKLDRSDYESERSQLISDGVAVLKQLDEAGLTTPANNMNAEIEQIAARILQPKSDLAASKNSCPQCDTESRSEDRLCQKCGYALNYFSEAP